MKTHSCTYPCKTSLEREMICQLFMVHCQNHLEWKHSPKTLSHQNCNSSPIISNYKQRKSFLVYKFHIKYRICGILLHCGAMEPQIATHKPITSSILSGINACFLCLLAFLVQMQLGYKRTQGEREGQVNEI